MTDDFLAAASSVETSQPREIYEIIAGTTVYRFASGARDIFYGGNLYTAASVARSELKVPQVGGDSANLEVSLPIDHPLVSRYFQIGVPPRRVSVVLRQLQGALAEIIWAGEVTSMACDGDNVEATLLVPPRVSESAERTLPTVTLGRSCLHLLYDTMCKIPRTLGSTYFSTPVMHVDGREVTIDLGVLPSDPARADWAVGGELYHPMSGERMSVFAQDDVSPGSLTLTKLTLQLPILELTTGDTVEVYAGCDHSLETCVNKFGNRQNYGGFPQMPKQGASLRFKKD